MARLVFLAVLLAAATYASADEPNHLTIKSCTDTAANECKNCDTTPLDYIADEKCHESSDSGYKATCEAAAEGGKKGKWTLELFTDKACTNPNTAAHTISSDQQCFDGNSITVNVKEIGAAAGSKHTVKLNLCPAAKPGTACTATAVTDEACPPKEITVAEGDAGTKCGEPTEGQKYYYTATVKDNKLTLALYTTKGTCTAKQLPVFEGKDMEASATVAEKSCKTFQQKLNAVSCAVPTTTTETETTTTTASTTDNNTDNSSNSSTNDDTNGSAAVSAVLALLAAACAVWMM